MTTATETKSIQFAVVAALALGAPLEEGAYSGITTQPDGTPVAVIYLGTSDGKFDHDGCVAWALEHGGQLVTRAVFHLLRATIKDQLPKTGWCFTADTLDMDTGRKADASIAWDCGFVSGYTGPSNKSVEARAVAFRLIPLTA